MTDKLHGVFLTLKEIDALSKACGILLHLKEGKPLLDDFFSYPPALEALESVDKKLDSKATEIDAEENRQ